MIQGQQIDTDLLQRCLQKDNLEREPLSAGPAKRLCYVPKWREQRGPL